MYYHSLFVGVSEAERHEIDVICLFLVDASALDRLSQELVHPVGWLKRPRLSCLSLATQYEPFGHLDLKTICKVHN